jgi:hypothetical protein
MHFNSRKEWKISSSSRDHFDGGVDLVEIIDEVELAVAVL